MARNNPFNSNPYFHNNPFAMLHHCFVCPCPNCIYSISPDMLAKMTALACGNTSGGGGGTLGNGGARVSQHNRYPPGGGHFAGGGASNCAQMQLPFTQATTSPHSTIFKRNSHMSPGIGGGGSAGGGSVFQQDRFNGTPNFHGSMSGSPSVFQSQRYAQKPRKPYFMPYISEGAMLRGLKSGELLKGILRINRHNYEEAFVEVLNVVPADQQQQQQQQQHQAQNASNNNNVGGAGKSYTTIGGDSLELSGGDTSPRTLRPANAARKLLLLNVHDRNRALHGDEVVVRLKDRSQWIVREAMYQSWRSGDLNALFDENGQPVPVPPLKPAPLAITDANGTLVVADDNKVAVTAGAGHSTTNSSNDNNNVVDAPPAGNCDANLEFLPAPFHERIDLNEVGKTVPVPDNRRYDAAEILKLGATMEFCRRKFKHNVDLPESVRKSLKNLSISRDSKKTMDGSNSFTFGSVVQSGRYHVTGHGAHRTTYRLLSDMPDDDWGMPDICLQKTAEVVYIFKNRNSREAIGHLKVMADGNRNWALFSPTDSRMPRMMVPAEQLPNGFFENAADYAKMTYMAQLVDWAATAQFARGRLLRQQAADAMTQSS